MLGVDGEFEVGFSGLDERFRRTDGRRFHYFSFYVELIGQGRSGKGLPLLPHFFLNVRDYSYWKSELFLYFVPFAGMCVNFVSLDGSKELERAHFSEPCHE